MRSLAVNVALIEAGHILLILREDFEVWCMPGGHVENDESIADAAVRELKEETGLDVRLERFVGTYSRPRWLDGAFHVAVFAGKPTGGTPRAQPGEVVELRTFPLGALPAPMMMGQRQRIDDAAAGVAGIARSSQVEFPFESFEAAVQERDASPLSRSEFYIERFLRPHESEADRDVEQVPAGEPASAQVFSG